MFELPLIFVEHDPEIPVALILTFVPIFIVTDDVVIVIRLAYGATCCRTEELYQIS